MSNLKSFQTIADKLGYTVERNIYGDNLINGIEQAIITRDGVTLYYYDRNRKSYNDNHIPGVRISCATTKVLAEEMKKFKQRDIDKLDEIDDILGELC